MKKTIVTAVLSLAILVGAGSAVFAGPFYAVTNQLGYQGTVWNITQGTGPWSTHTPRNADLYVVVDAPQIWTNYNQLMSSWYSHPASNQNDSFLQLAVDGAASPWSATGGWDSSMTVFTVNASGSDATYENSWSRFWQPDNGVAWGVTFTNYGYSFTATFADAAVIDSGWLVNSANPTGLTGSFWGEFKVTYDPLKNPIQNGDTYGFLINFDSSLLDAPTGSDFEAATSVGTPVPEPATLTLLGLGLAGIARAARRRKK